MSTSSSDLRRVFAQVDAVAFDCDGVLANTDAAWAQAEEELCRHHGVEFTSELRDATQGQPMDVSVRLLLGEVIEAKEVPALSQELIRLAEQTHSDGIQPLPGAVELVRHVANRMPVAVVSNTPRRLLDVVLSVTGVARWCTTSIAGDEGTPKPDPAPYLCAADSLGVRPSRMLVFEDSVPGVTAALAAGARVVAVEAPGRPRMAGVHASITSLEEALNVGFFGEGAMQK